MTKSRNGTAAGRFAQGDLRDILVVLDSYPEPAGKKVIESSVALAKKLDAHITALSFEIGFKIKTSLVARTLGVGRGAQEMLSVERQKSLSNAKELLRAFEIAAGKAGLRFDTILEESMQDEVSDAAIRHARLRDFTIVSTSDPELADSDAEDLLFGSGRPILIPPRNLKRGDAPSLDNIAVAWDSSRVATRAISDALPLLRLAKHVRVFTVLNEKALPSTRLNAELQAHLARHGIKAAIEHIDARRRPIVDVLRAYVEAKDIGMLVMGGYGHSRLKEFILGGATKAVLTRPFQWTFLSH